MKEKDMTPEKRDAALAKGLAEGEEYIAVVQGTILPSDQEKRKLLYDGTVLNVLSRPKGVREGRQVILQNEYCYIGLKENALVFAAADPDKPRVEDEFEVTFDEVEDLGFEQTKTGCIVRLHFSEEYLNFAIMYKSASKLIGDQREAAVTILTALSDLSETLE